MSRFLGEIRQLGYVVNDIEAAMEYWHRELGVGPWYYNPRVPIVNYRYRGEPHDVHNSVALANSGPMQVELIQTRNDHEREIMNGELAVLAHHDDDRDALLLDCDDGRTLRLPVASAGPGGHDDVELGDDRIGDRAGDGVEVLVEETTGESV